MPQETAASQNDLDRVEISDETKRRMLIACKRLNELLKSKLGDASAWGKFKVECHINGGQISLVNVVDDVNHK